LIGFNKIFITKLKNFKPCKWDLDEEQTENFFGILGQGYDVQCNI
jgi:hypothetical protein